jgi:cyanophycinase
MIRALLSLALLALPAAAQPATPGHLVLIGGGEKPPAAMAKFIELAGGKDAPIVVVPTASEAPDVMSYYRDLFKELGCTDVVVLPIKEKADANRADLFDAASRARGIFFGGGDQSRITKALLGTPVLDAMREAFRRGAVIAGTSAGTACHSRLMITGEGDFKVIREGAVELVEGLAFLPDHIIVDQHFIARQRENRLFTVILEHPNHLGVGVDEDTAAWFRPDGTFEVIGKGSVMVLDAKEGSVQRVPGEAESKTLLGVHGMRLHIVLPGEVFDTARRAIVRPSTAAAAR